MGADGPDTLRELLNELLEERREHEQEIGELDIVIGRLRSKYKERLDSNSPISTVTQDTQPYSDLSYPEAVLMLMRRADRALSTAEVRDALLEGGVESDAKNFHSTVYTTLKRLSEDGKVNKAGAGVWRIRDDG